MTTTINKEPVETPHDPAPSPPALPGKIRQGRPPTGNFRVITLLLGFLFISSCSDSTPLNVNTDTDSDVGFREDVSQSLCDDPELTECDGVCIDVLVDNLNCGECDHPCEDNQTCELGTCKQIKCQPLETVCDRQCVDTDHDHENCGECGNKCEADETCTRGECLAECPRDLTRCGSHCVNTNADPNHCGQCNHRCQSDETCLQGECESDQCPEGLTDCYGGCVNIQVDDSHCGRCGHRCPDDHVCWAATCILDCQEGLTDCDFSCVDTQTDTRHCGGCGRPCSSGEVCDQGECHLTCQEGLTDCLGVCTNLLNDRTNCGFCTNHCLDGQVCVGGECTLNCPTGLTKCDLNCINIHTDRLNCGECGHACQAGQACSFGKCETTCPQGQTPCDNVCATLSRDDSNCGECGNRCQPGETCVEGRCELACPAGYHPCGELCVITATDNTHCGRCNNQCSPGATCRNGQCVTMVTGLSVSPVTTWLNMGDQKLLTASVTPPNATDQSLTWASDAPQIATVNNNGAVTGHTAGQAVITVTSNDGSYRATSLVTVTIPVTTVTIIPEAIYLLPGQASNLQAVVLPEDASNRAVTWTTGNQTIATVDSAGRVQAGSSLGNTTITATTADGGKQATATVTVARTPATGITIEPKTTMIFPGEQIQLNGIVHPVEASNKSVLWHSSDPATVTMDRYGVATALEFGQSTVTGITVDGGYTDTATVMVGVVVTGVELTPSSLKLPQGTQLTLNHQVFPEDATNPAVSWTSSNPAVATVNDNGQVSGIKIGTTIITVTTDNGGYTASCTVNVVIPVTGVTVNPATTTIATGSTTTVTATVQPANAGNQTLVWTSSDTSVATISGTGPAITVSGRKSGTAIITATTEDGGFTGTCTLSVGRYVFTTHTFTNCTRTGYTGPTLAQCRSAYNTEWSGDTGLYNVSSGVQLWTVPDTGTYRIEVKGSKGGGSSGGYGAVIAGTFDLTMNEQLRIIVGQQGYNNSSYAGGGGASAVSIGTGTPMIVAGGGGGSGYYSTRTVSDASSTGNGINGYQSGGRGGTNGTGGNAGYGGGGGGWSSNGGSGSVGTAYGGNRLNTTPSGGSSTYAGGFGGGGAGVIVYSYYEYDGQLYYTPYYCSGGGGGYSGGGGGGLDGCGGGGGSYNTGSNPSAQGGAHNDHGRVIITKL